MVWDPFYENNETKTKDGTKWNKKKSKLLSQSTMFFFFDSLPASAFWSLGKMQSNNRAYAMNYVVC